MLAREAAYIELQSGVVGVESVTTHSELYRTILYEMERNIKSRVGLKWQQLISHLKVVSVGL